MDRTEIQSITEKQKRFYNTGKTKDVKFRLKMLYRLKHIIKKNEKEIFAALKRDLNKAEFEAYVTEIGIVYEEINYMLRHLPYWMKRKRVETPLMHFPSASYIYREPYGTVLIMAPWNYPFQLTMVPLAGAIAAGNCVVVKPSDYAPATAAVIKRLLSEIFADPYIAVVTGGRVENQSLLKEKFDYIFFTGSVSVGQSVMKAAANHLTPVTLELGGKSPCIVDETANLDLAAKRIVWGKFLNAGQTCVAPDYLFVHETVKDALIMKMNKYIVKMYGTDPCLNPEYPKIINQKHFQRLLGLMEGEAVVTGGVSSERTRQIAPTILDSITWDSPIMQEEIFGPVLPVLTYTRFSRVLEALEQRPKPLALYLFTSNKRKEQYVMRQISFGGGCVNDTVIHLSNPHLSFGGTGESGMGQYHGKSSFETFSRPKSVICKSDKIDIPLRYPPYKKHLKLVKYIMK